MEANFFRHETLGWTLYYAGKTAQLKHRKGLRYIATLLREPERKMHVCDLACASPERASDPLMGCTDGLAVFRSMVAAMAVK